MKITQEPVTELTRKFKVQSNLIGLKIRKFIEHCFCGLIKNVFDNSYPCIYKYD